MADNVAITAGSGTTIATDDVTGVHYQYIKLADGTLNSSQVVATGDGTGTASLRVSLANDTSNKVTPIASTSGGLSTYHVVSAASTNAANIKASAGQVYGWSIYNTNVNARKVALHNTSGTPTAGASVFLTITVPGSSNESCMTDIGIPFSSGIGITTVTGAADSDTSTVASNDLIINIFYK